VLEVSVEALFLICMAVITVFWIRSRSTCRKSAATVRTEGCGNSTDRDVVTLEGLGCEASKHLAEETWTPAEVYAAYAKYYEGMCEEELENLENYSPK
jgi:hypothetical protein